MRKNVEKVDLADQEIELVSRSLFTERYNGAIIHNYVFDVYLLDTDTIIGFCDLRLGNQQALLYLGNIGYSILFPYRGNSYATKSVRLLLRLVQALNETEIYITCNPDNVASIRTIEKLGATLINRVDVPKNDSLYKQGDREKNIYKIDVGEAVDE